MMIKTLDGIEYKWKLESKQSPKPSSSHIKVRELLHKIYPTVQILEEIEILVKKNKRLYLDFYIPLYSIAVEIDGQQHSKQNTFFHKNKYSFIKQQINDRLKEEFCELNNIKLVKLRDDEEDKWRKNFYK